MGLFYLGIDGGGTSCRAAIANSNGEIIGRGISGAANILSDPDGALKHILEASSFAFNDAKLSPDYQNTHAILGLAGTNVGEAVGYVTKHLPFKSAYLVSDGLIALQGAIGHEDGAIGILGTGSVFVVRNKGCISSIGGWGFRVGDFGSGARLGQALLQETLLCADGINQSTPLIEAVLTQFKHRPELVANYGAEAKPGDFGKLAPLIFDHAKLNDRTAIKLIEDAASTINAALEEVTRRLEGGKISLLGGLAPLLQPYLASHLEHHLIPAKNDAVTGAVQLAALRHTEKNGSNHG